VDKENRQISPGVCLPKRSINVFTKAVPLFNKVDEGRMAKDFSYFLLLNIVFLRQFFNDIFKP